MLSPLPDQPALRTDDQSPFINRLGEKTKRKSTMNADQQNITAENAIRAGSVPATGRSRESDDATGGVIIDITPK
jgi:hypothetical protein